MDNEQRCSALILFSLARKRKWGESHTAYENLFKVFRSEALGKHGMNDAKNVADNLIKNGFIIRKPTSYGMQVSLNPNKSQEIKKLIKEQLGFDL